MTSSIDQTSGLVADFGVDRGGFSLDVAFSIPVGSTLALLGPNGAGKSTAVAALAGSLAIDRGHITLGGVPLDRAPGPDRPGAFVASEQRQIGVVFQSFGLFPHMSALDNVAFGLRFGPKQLRKRDAAAGAQKWLDRLGVGGVSEAKASAVSGGQAQRIAVARALAVEPRLLLLDEPLSALDVSTRAELRRTLRQHLGEFAGPSLLITHDPTEAFVLADQVCILEHGRVVQIGTPDEIRAHPATSYVADLAGLNLLSGSSKGPRLELDGFSIALQTATSLNGRVLASIRPNAISLHATAPHGSPRNTWESTVRAIEPLGDTVRVQLDHPLPLMVDITPGAATDLGLQPGIAVWAAVKATEINVSSDE